MAVNTTFVDQATTITAAWLNWVNQVVNGIVGIGYLLAGVGTGGAVTQATSNTNPVTLNTYCGQITLFSALSMPLGTGQQFTLNNTKVELTDTIVLTMSGTTLNRGTLLMYPVITGTGTVQITLLNTSTVGALISISAPQINFSVIKGVAS